MTYNNIGNLSYVALYANEIKNISRRRINQLVDLHNLTINTFSTKELNSEYHFQMIKLINKLL